MTNFLRDNAIARYLRETWIELKKVRWPSRKEATNLTAVVLVVTVAMAIVLGLMDAIFYREFRYVFEGNPIAIGLGAGVLLVGLVALVIGLRQEEGGL